MVIVLAGIGGVVVGVVGSFLYLAYAFSKSINL